MPAVKGAFVINIGDLMARWTNDRWTSTLHRVVNPEGGSPVSARRQSMPFFHNATYSAVVEALPLASPWARSCATSRFSPDRTSSGSRRRASPPQPDAGPAAPPSRRSGSRIKHRR